MWNVKQLSCLVGPNKSFFFFFFPRKSHPELTEQLGELRRHLLESSNDMAPLKVWEMQGLSVSFFQLLNNYKLVTTFFAL